MRCLVLGPDLPGLVVMDRHTGPVVIHAMPMRASYRRLLPKGRREQADAILAGRRLITHLAVSLAVRERRQRHSPSPTV